MKTHRETYPEQYEHPLCGRRVRVVTGAGFQTDGVVERVVSTRFGLLAHLEGEPRVAWALNDCTPVERSA